MSAEEVQPQDAVEQVPFVSAESVVFPWTSLLRKAVVVPIEGMVVRTTHDSLFSGCPKESLVRLCSEDHLKELVHDGSFGSLGEDGRRFDEIYSSVVPWMLDRATFLLCLDVVEERGIVFCGWGEARSLTVKEARSLFFWGKYQNELVEGVAEALSSDRNRRDSRRARKLDPAG